MLYALALGFALLVGDRIGQSTICKDLPPAQQQKLDCPKPVK